MAAKNKGLGRGLEALFADQEPIDRLNEGLDDPEDKDAVKHIDINDIRPNRTQPRKNFSEEGIKELAASILEHGIIQPLVVRQGESGYEIVAGERRWRAAREAGLKKVPVLVRDFSDEENMLVTIIENMQREDLNPIEEAEGLRQMMDTYGLTQEEISKSVGKSRPYITNSVRLLKLPDSLKEYLAEGKLTAGHARALLSVSDKTRQEDLAARIVKEGLSVREVEKLSGESKSKKKKTLKRVKDRAVVDVENELKRKFGTKVSIDLKGKGGLLSFSFYSKDELNRLIDMMRMIDQE
jgi:ParB family chromosome partitioning protein